MRRALGMHACGGQRRSSKGRSLAQSKALRHMWMSVSAEDSAAMVDLLDTDHDGRISLDELRRFVYLLPEAQARPACAGAAWPVRMLHEEMYLYFTSYNATQGMF